MLHTPRWPGSHRCSDDDESCRSGEYCMCRRIQGLLLPLFFIVVVFVEQTLASTHSFLFFFGCHVCQLIATDSRMARAPCDDEMALTFGRRGQSVENLVFIGVGYLMGGVEI